MITSSLLRPFRFLAVSVAILAAGAVHADDTIKDMPQVSAPKQKGAAVPRKTEAVPVIASKPPAPQTGGGSQPDGSEEGKLLRFLPFR